MGTYKCDLKDLKVLIKNIPANSLSNCLFVESFGCHPDGVGGEGVGGVLMRHSSSNRVTDITAGRALLASKTDAQTEARTNAFEGTSRRIHPGTDLTKRY
jgi:hypothetical protein